MDKTALGGSYRKLSLPVETASTSAGVSMWPQTRSGRSENSKVGGTLLSVSVFPSNDPDFAVMTKSHETSLAPDGAVSLGSFSSACAWAGAENKTITVTIAVEMIRREESESTRDRTHPDRVCVGVGPFFMYFID